jgi:hypothetical protein
MHTNTHNQTKNSGRKTSGDAMGQRTSSHVRVVGVHTHTQTHTHTHTRMHTHMRTHMQIHTRTHKHTHISHCSCLQYSLCMFCILLHPCACFVALKLSDKSETCDSTIVTPSLTTVTHL